MTRRLLVGVVLALACVSPLEAQVSGAVATAVGRARSMIEGGDGAAARTLLDSLVARTEPSSDDLAEALYWRAVLSERVIDGERDWKRLVVDAPLSPRVPDALLRLGELEILRGRPAVARAHFERILRDFAESAQRPKAMVWIARSFFEERDVVHACETVTAMRTAVFPEGELRLQADELQARCVTINSAASASPSSPAVKDTASRSATSATPVSARAMYSVQIAAYDTRGQANAVVARLMKRGIKARVDGERAPYRVRVGRYETRSEAAAMLARLKKQGQRGFVAELGR